MNPHRVISTLIFLVVCCTFSLSDDSQDQAFKALADLSAVGSRRSYGAGPSSSYASYGNQYQSVPVPVPISPVTSYGYGQPQVILPKAPFCFSYGSSYGYGRGLYGGYSPLAGLPKY